MGMGFHVSGAGELGDFFGGASAGQTLNFKFNTWEVTAATTAAPITLAGSPVVSVYKTNSLTQSTAGITLSVDFDGVVGLHNVNIDLTADTAFYASNSDFQAVLTAGTVDGDSVVGSVIASFSINHRFDRSYATVDTTASTYMTTLKLKAIDIRPEAGNVTAFQAQGVGSGRGIYAISVGVNPAFEATATGNNSYGMFLYGGGTGAYGLYVQADGTGGIASRFGGTTNGMAITASNGAGMAVSATGGNGSAATFTGNGSGHGVSLIPGATGHGLRSIGGATSGNAVNLTATAGNSSALVAAGQGAGHGASLTGGTTGNGFNATGGGIGHGASLTGGNTGSGILVSGGATSGVGLDVGASDHAVRFTSLANDGTGLLIAGQGTGHGIRASSGTGATGDGIRSDAQSINGNGIVGIGTGAGHGVLLTAGATGSALRGTGGSSSGAAVNLTATAGNSSAISATGQGAGHALLLTAGATGNALRGIGGSSSGSAVNLTTTSGSGVTVVVGGGNGAGIAVIGEGSGSGILSTGGATGYGIYALSGTGATGDAMRLLAQSTNGNGLAATGTGTGHALGLVGGGVGGHAIYALGGASGGRGAHFEGGVDGIGVYMRSGTGPSVYGLAIQSFASSGQGHGMTVTGSANGSGGFWQGNGDGHGSQFLSGFGATGNGISAQSQATDGSGLSLYGVGLGAGLFAANPSGDDVYALDGRWPVSAFTPLALAQFFTVDTGQVYTTAVAGSVVGEIISGTTAGVGVGVWDELQAAHMIPGTFGWSNNEMWNFMRRLKTRVGV